MSQSFSMAELLSNAKPGDDDTVGQLLPVVYAELKALAGSYLKNHSGHTLQPTALVHEAYLKLVAKDRQWAGRDHFVATAAKAMRQVLVDHARGKQRQKRGGDGRQAVDRSALSIETIADIPGRPGRRGGENRELHVLELDELLTRLAQDDSRASRVAEMRLFGGMEQEQIARVLGISRKTVTSDWAFARAWLADQYGASRREGSGGDE